MRLARDFERKAREAILDEAEAQLVGEYNPLVFQAVQFTHDRLREYGREFDYNVEPIIESFGGVAVERRGDRLLIRWGWEHEAAVYLEFGTSDHEIQGQPILSFVWEDPPEWVAEEFEQEGDGYRVFLPEVEVAGIEETRAVRDALNWLRAELRE